MQSRTFEPVAHQSLPTNWDSVLADLCRQTPDMIKPPILRVSRMEAVLADVFENGLTTMAPQDFRRAA